MAETMVAEVVLFWLKPGVERETFLAAAEATTAFLREEMGGFRERELMEDGSGRWLDVVRWASLEEAQAAAAAFATSMRSRAFVEMIDPESMTMLHLRPAAAWH